MTPFRLVVPCLAGIWWFLVPVAQGNTPPVGAGQTFTTVEETAVEITLAGSDAESHFGRLSDYTRQGPITALAEIPDNLSGVTWNDATQSLFLVRNQPGSAHCYEYSPAGAHVRTITQSGFKDTESIEWIAGDLFAVGEENNEQRVNFCVMPAGAAATLTRTAPGNTAWVTSLGNVANLGVESMCYNPEADRLYYCAEKPADGHWYLYAMDPVTGVSAVLCDLQPTIAAAGVATDLSDMAYDRAARNFLLLSHESDKVIRVDFAGNVLETLPGLGFTQAEGMTISQDRKQLFVVGEANQFARYTLPADTLTYAVAAGPAHGTLRGLAPSLVYVPEADFHGTDSFTFTLHDGTETSTPVTVEVTVTPVNDAPAASGAALITAEDAPLPVTLTAVDPDGDALIYTVTEPPTHGSLTGEGRDLIYTPAPGYHGADGFSYVVNDGTVSSGAAEVALTVTPVNDTPVAAAQSAATSEDTAATITLGGSDEEGSALVFAVKTQPEHGTLSGTAPDLVYTPGDDYHGADSFTFTVRDDATESAPATVAIAVTSVNDPPVALASALSATEDLPLALTLSGADVDGDALAYTILSPPEHGTLSGVAPDLTYTPAAGYHGEDGFSFAVSDGGIVSDPARIELTVAAVNDAPVAASRSVATAEDAVLSITLSGTDEEGSPLDFSIKAASAHGTLSGTPPDLVYKPNADYHGLDSFTFTVSDGMLESAEAVVEVSVSSVNDAPSAAEVSLATAEDTALEVTLSGTDADGDALVHTITTPPANGVLSGVAPHLIYTPSENFHGADGFVFKVSDGEAESAAVSVTISVTAVNDVPAAESRDLAVEEDGALPLILRGTDADGDALDYAITRLPARGRLSGTPPELIYSPSPDTHGPDSFLFRVTDPSGASSEAVVNVAVASANDVPEALSDTLVGDEDTPLEVILAGTDADGEGLAHHITEPPAHGRLTGDPPLLTYVPDPDFHGLDSFRHAVSDGASSSAVAEVWIFVAPENDPPEAHSAALATAEDESLPVNLSSADRDGDELTHRITRPPAHGSLSGNPPHLLYIPNADFHGTDSFAFLGSDGVVESDEAEITVTVTAVNDAPLAQAASAGTPEDTVVAIPLSGTDADGDAVTFSLLAAPAHGTLTGTFPDMIYTPAADWHGEDTFFYLVSDGVLLSVPVVVSVTVSAVNDVPVATPLAEIVAEDGEIAMTLAGTDADGDVLAVSITAQPANGILLGTAPDLVYHPNPGFHGADRFSYSVNDGVADSAPAEVGITVTAVNDAPVAEALAVSGEEDATLAVTLAGTDPEGDALQFQVTEPPLHGALSGTPPHLTYTPAADWHGDDSFRYRADDGDLESASAEVRITIRAVNDAPVAAAAVLETTEDTPLPLTLRAADVDGETLVFRILRAPLRGTLSGTFPELLYTPDLNFAGTDEVEFSATDGAGVVGTAVLAIRVNPVNDPPVAAGLDLVMDEDTSVVVLFSATDAEEDAVEFEIVSPPAHGVLERAGPDWRYTPHVDFHGEDTFTFLALDAGGAGPMILARLRVEPVQDPPVTVYDVYSVNEDSALSVSAAAGVTRNDRDPDGAEPPLRVTLVAPPAHGAEFSLTEGGGFTYRPRPDFHGLDAFTYSVTDGAGAVSGVETALLAVLALNDAPIARAKAVTTLQAVAARVTLRSTDVDLLTPIDALELLPLFPPNPGPAPHDADPVYRIVEPPLRGNLSGTAPRLIYTPVAGFSGEDSFLYAADDGLAEGAPALVTVTVIADSDADSLPDEWENARFATLEHSGADDPDGDGRNTVEEYLTGHDPADGGSFLRLEPAGPRFADGYFRIDRVRPGLRYLLQTSVDLLSWEDVKEARFELEGAGLITDALAAERVGERRFYRVAAAPEDTGN